MLRKFNRGCNVICTGSTNVLELLTGIVEDYKKIDEYFISDDLLTVLNSTQPFRPDDVFSLLWSFNEYKSNSNDQNNSKGVFILILNSTFISVSLEPIIKKYLLATVSKVNIEILLTFSINCLELLPNPSIRRMTLLYPCILVISQQWTDDGNVKVLSESFGISLEKNIKNIVNQTLSRNVDRSQYRNVSNLPQYLDVFSLDRADIDELNEQITYESVDHYLETKFRSLKESYIRPLGDFLKTIKEKTMSKSKLGPNKSEFGIYENVIIDSLYPFRNELVYRIVFDATTSSRHLQNSKIFNSGSFLCFTNNGFETIYFASVVDNYSKNLSKGILLVQFNEDPMKEVMCNNRFVMVESKIQSDPYLCILARLQTFTANTLPFKENLVFGTNNCKSIGFPDEVDVEALRACADTEFDEYEREAFINGLRSNLCLINGRTNTGKSYICRRMIINLISRNICPILVVCYDNNSLDRLLDEIMKTIGPHHIVRVGGTSNHRCNILNIKQEWVNQKQFPLGIFSRFKRYRARIDTVEENLVRKYVELANCSKRILSVNNLRTHMGIKHWNYFKENDFKSWLTQSESFSTNTLQKCSVKLQNLLQEQCDMCIEDVVRDTICEVTVKLFKENTTPQKRGRKTIENSKETDIIDVDIFRTEANLKAIKRILNTIDPMTEEEYQRTVTLDLDFDVRWRLYRFWFEMYRTNLLNEYKSEKKNYDNLNKEKEQIALEEYLCIMKVMKVIIMTTSSAAKYGSLMEKVGCQVVVVEEADKVPESHLICSLSKHCQQLIMVGDSSDEIKSSQKHDFGVILFDKLLANNTKHFTLKHSYVGVQCGQELDCGHRCMLPYHKGSPSHDGKQCAQSCLKLCPRRLHRCKLACSEICRCEEEVIVALTCGHHIEIVCYMNESLKKCTEQFTELLTCGHNFTSVCGITKDRKRKCLEICNKVMDCGHICRKKCSEGCMCEEFVDQMLACHHQKRLKCGIDSTDSLCVVTVERKFHCGHTIGYRCFENLERCNIEVDTTLGCGHSIKINCGAVSQDVTCKRRCDVKLYCEHKCQGICGDCHLGLLHIECKRKCQKYLKCGHQCNSFCHPGLCRPCSFPCRKFCKHSTCSSSCGDICDCVVCLKNCDESINCRKCNVLEKCSKMCGEKCSKMCKACSTFQNLHYVMYPCKCRIFKKYFSPKFEVKNKEANLRCQKCNVCLQSPYFGAIYLFYKKEYSVIFKPLQTSYIVKWTDLFDKIKANSSIPSNNLEEILACIKEGKICNEDMPRFNIAYENYQEIADICKTINSFGKSINLDSVEKYTKTPLSYLTKWLNPLIRHFESSEMYALELERTKLHFQAEIFKFLNSTTVHIYALVHKQCYRILDKSVKTKHKDEIEKVRNEFDEIKKNLKNKGEITREEEELVEKINKSKNICKDFNIELLPKKEKLKEIKNLIRRCHPDKNNSLQAQNAVQVLLLLKREIE